MFWVGGLFRGRASGNLTIINKTIFIAIRLGNTFIYFPDSSVGKEFAWNARYPGLIPGSGRSSGEGKGYPLQYSSLESSMDCIVHGVAKSQTRLSDFQFHFSLGWKPLSFPLLERFAC